MLATAYAYAVETIQHFRGINPRFTRIGSITDTIFGVLFGVNSLVIIVATVLIGWNHRFCENFSNTGDRDNVWQDDSLSSEP